MTEVEFDYGAGIFTLVLVIWLWVIRAYSPAIIAGIACGFSLARVIDRRRGRVPDQDRWKKSVVSQDAVGKAVWP